MCSQAIVQGGCADRLSLVHPDLTVAPRAEVMEPRQGFGDVQPPGAEERFDMVHGLIAIAAIPGLPSVQCSPARPSLAGAQAHSALVACTLLPRVSTGVNGTHSGVGRGLP